MYLESITTKQAENIIINGLDKGFSIITIQENTYNIYHRIYENKQYDILEMVTEYKDESITTFYILDSDEVKLLLNKT